MPGTPFHEEGENRVYRLPPGRCISSSEGVAAEQTGSRAAGTGGARVDAVERPAVSPRS